MPIVSGAELSKRGRSVTASLRDEFAAAALAGGLEQGVCSDIGGSWWHSPEHIAKRVYAIADAMIKEGA
jgi:hypothetical protein